MCYQGTEPAFCSLLWKEDPFTNLKPPGCHSDLCKWEMRVWPYTQNSCFHRSRKKRREDGEIPRGRTLGIREMPGKVRELKEGLAQTKRIPASLLWDWLTSVELYGIKQKGQRQTESRSAEIDSIVSRLTVWEFWESLGRSFIGGLLAWRQTCKSQHIVGGKICLNRRKAGCRCKYFNQQLKLTINNYQIVTARKRDILIKTFDWFIILLLLMLLRVFMCGVRVLVCAHSGGQKTVSGGALQLSTSFENGLEQLTGWLCWLASKLQGFHLLVLGL